MAEISLPVWGIIAFIAGSFLGIVIMCILSYYRFRQFSDHSDAMKYYRNSCNQAPSHKLMRLLILLAAVGFLIYAFSAAKALPVENARYLCCGAALLLAGALWLRLISGAGELMARTRLVYHIRKTYSIPDGIVCDWLVELDDEYYPAELQVALESGGGIRYFSVDLEHDSIHEIHSM